MMDKLWGDNYHDHKASKWKYKPEADDGSVLKRAFVQYIMEPVIRLCRATRENEIGKVEKMIGSLGITLK